MVALHQSLRALDGGGLVEELLDFSSNVLWLGGWSVSLYDFSVLVNEELCGAKATTEGILTVSKCGSLANLLLQHTTLTGKVPRDTRDTQYARLFTLEELEHIIRVGSINIRLGHHWETDSIILHTERSDSLVILRLLVRKLVARESQDDETLILVFLVQFLQTFQLWCEPALGCSVCDEDHFAF